MIEQTHPISFDPVVQVRDLCKNFGYLQAVDGISFDLHEGEFLSIFGPNGAGKTTLIKILSGLTRPSSGSATVAGFDVLSGDTRLRREIGVISHANTLLTSCPSKYEAEKEDGKMHPGTLPDYQKQPAPDFKQTETLPKAAI